MNSDNANANLGGTLPAEVFNISTTATFLSTAGELLYAIQDWPAKTSFLILLQDWPGKAVLCDQHKH